MNSANNVIANWSRYKPAWGRVSVVVRGVTGRSQSASNRGLQPSVPFDLQFTWCGVNHMGHMAMMACNSPHTSASIRRPPPSLVVSYDV